MPIVFIQFCVSIFSVFWQSVLSFEPVWNCRVVTHSLMQMLFRSINLWAMVLQCFVQLNSSIIPAFSYLRQAHMITF